LAEERQAVVYRYDGLGRRVEEVWTDQNGTLTTRFAYDGDNVWADLDHQNRLSQRRLYGPGTDQPVAVLTPDSSSRGYTVNWYGQDLLGNIRWVFTITGDSLQQLTYTPFGGRSAVDSLGNATILVKVVAFSLSACTILKIALVIPSSQTVIHVFCCD
jgi:YD repeat-containing protein